MTTIEISVDFLAHVMKVLYEIEKPLNEGNSSTILPDSEQAENIDHIISHIQNTLLENKVHPDQKLIDAGFYKHLYGFE